MKRFASLILLLVLVSLSRADLVYLKQGEVISGTITSLDSLSLVVTLADGQTQTYQLTSIFQATDDAGKLLYPAAPQPTNLPQLAITPSRPASENSLLETTNYRRVYRFPLWPVLSGTLLLGYIGVDQLVKSSDSYDESVTREEAGLEFNTLRNQSLKQRTWGQISLAGAAVCLLVGLTPHVEKVPVQQTLHVVPTPNGFMLCLSY